MLNHKPIIKRLKRRRDEADMQAAFFKWLLYQYPHLRNLCFHIPNGGSRNIKEAANLKRQGVLAGVPDIICNIGNDKWHGLYIEMKANDNKLTKEQQWMFERLTNAGYKCAVCYSLEETIKVFVDYVEERN